MRVCIHRGAAEIGRNVVEVEHDGARVVLDLGLPLAAALDGESLPLTIGGLLKPNNRLPGAVITHGHPDHYGLIAQVDPDIPVYVGAATARILAEAAFFTPMGARIQPTGLLADRTPFELGPFKITPFLVDHSAFDAYALLVEAGGRRLFYSGDLRGHGRKHRLFERLISNPPPDIDALIVEGTRMGEADAASRGLASEDDVERLGFEAKSNRWRFGRARIEAIPGSRSRGSYKRSGQSHAAEPDGDFALARVEACDEETEAEALVAAECPADRCDSRRC